MTQPPVAGGDSHSVAPNGYQLTLAGLVLPVWAHYAFNALSAGAMWALGHPGAAGVMFLSACAFDTGLQAVLRWWIAEAPRTPEAVGFRRIGALSALRVAVYMAPVYAVARTGGDAELLFFGLQFCAMAAIAISAGALSRLMFWSFAAPALAAASGLVLGHLSGWPAAGVLASLASLAVMMMLISLGTSRAIRAWHAAFTTNIAMMNDLAAARDEARRAQRAASAFLATMSHEIRTPMNGVLGMAQLLKRDETDPRQAQRIDTLIDSGKYLMGILNDVLDISKIDAGHMEIVHGVEDLQLFLDRLVGFWGGRAQEKGVRLGLQVQEGLPEFVQMDALRLRQVLFNLMGNALKFTERGSVDVLVSAESCGPGSVRLRIAVRDTGSGIPQDKLATLFDRFTQADASEARRFGGTGLGLAIARQLTELMGGRISVESRLGKGSTFIVELPIEIAARPRQPEHDAEAPAPSDALSVLAVDDNPVNLQVIGQLLGSFGHDVVRAASGREALDLMAHQAFDLVLMDIQMPGMTGIETLQELRAQDGPNRHAPVIALTADVTSGGRQRYLDLGFTDHASKPIQVEELLEVVVRALSGPAAPEAAEALTG
ncbi:ATP-binding protein [Phenylobacterium sp.]|jgi:signal transduction histidine kinase/CheY-like chemotaxis protein|uniref:ATP-binding protein n=1 Tax=Phenylobacterium sp. TaxID=1871053 RepID=UPI002F9225A2